MIDSHCHLDHEPLISDLNNVIQRSKDVGIKKLLTISTSIDSFSKIKQLIHKDDIIYGTVGIHPHESDKNILTSSQLVQKFQENEKIIGIGETGLDFYYNYSDKSDQISLFLEHISASQKTNLPLIIHTRSAEFETFKILKESVKKSNLKILIHCFTGTKDFAFKLLDIGAYISASGVVTFKKSKELVDTFKNIPMDRILVETDSPYLAPIPFRGKRCEPMYVKNTTEFIANLRGTSLEKIAHCTSRNADSFFNF